MSQIEKIEVFNAVAPEDGREFVAILTWYRVDPKNGKLFPMAVVCFYDDTERGARGKAVDWLAAERKKIADVDEGVRRRAEERAAAKGEKVDG